MEQDQPLDLSLVPPRFLASTGSPGSHSVCVCVRVSVIFVNFVHYPLCRSGRYFVLFLISVRFLHEFLNQRIPKDGSEAIIDDNEEIVNKSMHNEEPEIGKIAKQSPSSRNSLAILEKKLNETTTPTTTTASTSTTELASTAITEQDLREEATEGPPKEIKEDSSNNSKEINNNNDVAKDQVNRISTPFSPRFRNEPSHKNKNVKNDDESDKIDLRQDLNLQVKGSATDTGTEPDCTDSKQRYEKYSKK